MKLQNSTDWSDTFLRRMVSWVCKQIDLSPSKVRKVAFGNRSRGPYSGHAWQSMRIHCSIGPSSEFPRKGHLYPGRTSEAFRSPDYADRMECLIGITAHELTHLFEYSEQSGKPNIRALGRGSGERRTMFNERCVTEAFRANREALIDEWCRETPRKGKVKPSIQEQRAVKAANDLARWQRKLKLAQTKVKQYKKRVRYYDKAIAATSSDKTNDFGG